MVLIILSIACLLLIGTSYLLSRSSVKALHPFSKPQLNQDLLKEVMIFGASGTVGDGFLKALLLDKNVQKIQVITRRLTAELMHDGTIQLIFPPPFLKNFCMHSSQEITESLAGAYLQGKEKNYVSDQEIDDVRRD